MATQTVQPRCTQEIYDGLIKIYDQQYENLKKITTTDTASFRSNLDLRNRSFQDSKVTPLPQKDSLQTEMFGYIETHKGFEKALETIKALKKTFESVKNYQKPSLAAQDMEFLKKEFPDLHAKIMKDIEVGLKQFEKLDSLHKTLETLNEQMEINLPKATESLKLFCRIVDNEGKPVSTIYGYLFTTNIPKEIPIVSTTSDQNKDKTGTEN